MVSITGFAVRNSSFSGNEFDGLPEGWVNDHRGTAESSQKAPAVWHWHHNRSRDGRGSLKWTEGGPRSVFHYWFALQLNASYSISTGAWPFNPPLPVEIGFRLIKGRSTRTMCCMDGVYLILERSGLDDDARVRVQTRKMTGVIYSSSCECQCESDWRR